MPDNMFKPGELGEYKPCPKCGERGFANIHYCNTVFICRLEEYDASEGQDVRAKDARKAAELYMDIHFGMFPHPRSATVVVVDPDSAIEYQIEVIADSVPVYLATITAEKPYKPVP